MELQRAEASFDSLVAVIITWKTVSASLVRAWPAETPPEPTGTVILLGSRALRCGKVPMRINTARVHSRIRIGPGAQSHDGLSSARQLEHRLAAGSASATENRNGALR